MSKLEEGGQLCRDGYTIFVGLKIKTALLVVDGVQSWPLSKRPFIQCTHTPRGLGGQE